MFKIFNKNIIIVILLLTACSDSDKSSSNTDSTTDNTIINRAQHILVGQIKTADNIATDSDTNDVNAIYRPNDSVSTAQSIPNPVILGGYVNRPQTGAPGRSYQNGDIDDFFRVTLRRGQVINLFIASDDLKNNDLDLALLDREGNILNASVGDAATESLVVPSDGTYYIQVHAHLGASNYILNIGQNLQSSSILPPMRLSDDIVAGEVLIEFVEADITALNTLHSLGLSTNNLNQDRRSRFKFADLSALNAQFSRTNNCLITEFGASTIPADLLPKYTTLMMAKCLNRHDSILAASPNYILSAQQVIPNDSFYKNQWNYRMINLPQAWGVTLGSSAVVVAVIDTGVLLNHPDLQGKLLPGYDFISDVSISLDGDGIDSNPDDPGDKSIGGSSFHGTHVAGIIGALSNNNAGIAGIGWQTRIMPLRVLGLHGNGNDYDVEQAIRYAVGLSNDSGTIPTQTADIINLSLGGPSISNRFRNVIQQARNAGAVIVAAAGNDNSRTPYYPASLDGVISVSAVDIRRQRASYSNYNQFVDITAPGGDNTPDLDGDGIPDGIISTVGDDSSGRIRFVYQTSTGTSMATPHVAGVISLMKAVNPRLTPDDIDFLLQNGRMTVDIGSVGRNNEFGYGLLDAHKSVLAATELTSGSTSGTEPLLAVSPQSLNFGTTITSSALTVTNAGGGDLRIVEVSHDAGSSLQINGSGLGEYQINLNRSGLTAGTYSAMLRVRSNINTISIPIIWQVAGIDTPSQAGNAGHHYVLLIDANTKQVTTQLSVSPINGVYDFRFTGISTGIYQVVAGTDSNNNNVICELGEACGAYLTLSSPSRISVDNSYSGVDFTTGYNVNLSIKASGNTDFIPSTGYQLLPKTDFKRLAD
jgi:serine protease